MNVETETVYTVLVFTRSTVCFCFDNARAGRIECCILFPSCPPQLGKTGHICITFSMVEAGKCGLHHLSLQGLLSSKVATITDT